METTVQALYVTAAGMALLFLALGVLMLAMNLTSRLLPFREEREETEEEAGAEEASEAGATRGSGDQGAVIAAAAVALALAERDAGFVPAAPPSGGAGSADAWVILGRQAQMLARQRG